MGWSIGYDETWQRDIGYGVPSICDQPDCGAEIHRGLAYVCGQDPYGGEHGCGLFFCEQHRTFVYTDDGEEPELPLLCERCARESTPFDPTPDTEEWVRWKLTDPSWQKWRDRNPRDVARMYHDLTPEEQQ